MPVKRFDTDPVVLFPDERRPLARRLMEELRTDTVLIGLHLINNHRKERGWVSAAVAPVEWMIRQGVKQRPQQLSPWFDAQEILKRACRDASELAAQRLLPAFSEVRPDTQAPVQRLVSIAGGIASLHMLNVGGARSWQLMDHAVGQYAEQIREARRLIGPAS